MQKKLSSFFLRQRRDKVSETFFRRLFFFFYFFSEIQEKPLKKIPILWIFDPCFLLIAEVESNIMTVKPMD